MKTSVITILMILIGTSLFGQAVLRKTDAIDLALKSNFDIREADNNRLIALNNSSKKNSGFLPSVAANGGVTYAITNSENTFTSGDIQSASGVQTERYNASIGANYILYNGESRKYNFKKFQESLNISELQSRGVIENVIVNIFNSYYEVARLTQNEITQKETLEVSRERLRRAKYSFDYGQNTQLEVLNAEVDYNNDSINYLNIVQQLENEKRNLNLFLGREVNTPFSVDTVINYTQGLSRKMILEKSLSNNVAVLQQNAFVRSAEYDIRINNGANKPTVGLNTNYGWNQNNLGATSFVQSQNSKALSYGATVSWNIFDGGLTSVRKQNNRIQLENQKLGMDRLKLNLNRDVNNAWSVYQTALFVLKAQEKNLSTNERNFSRTREQQSLGQITSIEFRQAQLNLLNAKLNYNQAKYSAKNAEMALLQLSGEIMDAEY
ncbi:MAG: TolC family protein [Cyclobacteriaceae bacterium]